MIRLWVLLDNEPPVTEAKVGQVVQLTCRWAPTDGLSIPAEIGMRIPSADIIERGGVPRVISRNSRVFEAYPDTDMSLSIPSTEWAQRPGVAREDKYLEPFLRRNVPEFSGLVQAVRYLWSADFPAGAVEQVTGTPTNPAPGLLFAVGKLVQVAVY